MSTENKDLYVFEDGLREVSTSLRRWPGAKKKPNTLKEQVGNDMELGFTSGILRALVQESERSGVAIQLVAGESPVPTVLAETDGKGRTILKPIDPLEPRESLQLTSAERIANDQTFGGERKITVEDLAVAIGHGATLEVSPSKADDN
ncbi:hypothetical protein HY004_03110 [Candidatus Saccharibacteria bacterium]|nr:hypothetical protein [Candidatus Saccharibacteria bacterium]